MVGTTQETEVSYLPPRTPPTNHGHTVAAWVAMIGIIVGALVGAVAFLVAEPWVFWVGMGIVVVALVVGGVMRRLGYGQADGHRKD
ncbi:hypothetical protein CLV28_1842 [Sediminihabitans luteus]|uniref:Uncharacterized protein n=1 Tax=Sediminihabitans luteus TaxID=1138585 RepID=A0A2M9CQZ2_9CELL|nr:HGxxPAAW family protein [Sediminihabitans luteus]PJJ74346.1 hypothetical protein CLV28_1842 [Sediminihabitans luteus]GIJ00458.1 hypothetical protein Slu03_28350 [Sediminihabitans luteus]